MSEKKYTAPQRYAIEEEHSNLLVAAAAGSGKTFTLSAHITELVRCGKADIGEILVVTFTRSAAADMKRKIAENLKKAAIDAKKNGDASSARLSRAALGVQSADISTMHSFLYKILKRYLSAVGLPQDSRLVSNDSVLGRLRGEVMRDTVDDLFEEADGDFLYLADILAKVRDADSIDDKLYEIAEKLSSNGLDAAAIGKYADMLSGAGGTADEIFLSPIGDSMRGRISDMLSHYKRVLTPLGEELALLCPGKCSAEIADILVLLAEAENAVGSGQIERLSEIFSGFSLPTFHPKKNEKGELSDAYRARRDELKLSMKKMADMLGKFSPREIILARDGTIRVLTCLKKVLGRYFDGYAKKKRELGILDFDDVENYTLRLLTDESGQPSELAREIGGRYKYVFIDEYQDTNKVQDAIFRAMSTCAKRFMVGDIKQAIYGFRGADPSVFAGYRSRWAEIDPEVDGGYECSADDGRVLMMSNNFRSAEPVTELTNAVSDLIFPYGSIPYTEGDRLICSKKDGCDPINPDAEVCVIEKKRASSKDRDDEDDISDKNDPETEYVAERIASMLGRQVGGAIVSPGDVAILLRHNAEIGDYKSALVSRGIPVFTDREEEISESPAVMLLMCLLNFADNPLRDVYCAGALRSPVFGFSVEELIALRECAGKEPLYLGVIGCARDGYAPTQLREKCASAVEWVGREKTVSRGMIPSKYLEYLIDEVELFSIDGIRKNGLERDAVNKLLGVAAEFEGSASSAAARTDIAAFIDYALEALTENKSEKKASATVDAVTITTIHKSKGLEFPVVFVPCCGKNLFGGTKFSKTVNFDRELGLGMYLPDESGLAICNTFFNVALVERMRETSLNEEMRILYVALSRAETKLIVTAKISSLEKLDDKIEACASVPDRHAVRGANKYIEWVLTALRLRPQNRVAVRYFPDGESDACEDGHTDHIGADGARTEGCASIDDFEKRAAFVYPYGYLSRLPAKLTVSKLSPAILDDSDDSETGDISSALDRAEPAFAKETAEPKLRRPDFMTGGRHATAAERGSATHVFMQFADFSRLAQNGAGDELERLVRERFISASQAELVNIRQIERFAESSLMDKLLRSDLIKREFRFNVRMPAEGFTRDGALAEQFAQSGAMVTVQGVVDCVFRDPDTGELTLIDYKTDHVNDEADLVARHKNQLSYYRDICSEMFGEPIPHAYLYSTVMGKLVEIK